MKYKTKIIYREKPIGGWIIRLKLSEKDLTISGEILYESGMNVWTLKKEDGTSYNEWYKYVENIGGLDW